MLTSLKLRPSTSVAPEVAALTSAASVIDSRSVVTMTTIDTELIQGTRSVAQRHEVCVINWSIRFRHNKSISRCRLSDITTAKYQLMNDLLRITIAQVATNNWHEAAYLSTHATSCCELLPQQNDQRTTSCACPKNIKSILRHVDIPQFNDSAVSG